MKRASGVIAAALAAVICSGCITGSGRPLVERAVAGASAEASRQAFVAEASRRTLLEAKRDLIQAQAEMLALVPLDQALDHWSTSETRNLLDCGSGEDLHSWPYSTVLEFDPEQVDAAQLMRVVAAEFASRDGWSVTVGGGTELTEKTTVRRDSDGLNVRIWASTELGDFSLRGSSACFLLKNYDPFREF